jgi:hypothetical protein
MPDLDSRLDKHVAYRPRMETIIRLTMTSENGAPKPNPVWFNWDRRRSRSTPNLPGSKGCTSPAIRIHPTRMGSL